MYIEAVARKKKRKKGSAESEAGTPAPRPSPERLSRPFAEALSGVRAPEKREPPATAPGAGRAPAGVPPRRPSPVPASPIPPPSSSAQKPADYSDEDRAAWGQAYGDVRPLGSRDASSDARRAEPKAAAPSPGRVPRAVDEAEALARERLASLVARGVRFEIARDEDGRVEAVRAGAGKTPLAALRGGRAEPDAEIDLHGFSGDEAARSLVRFIRDRHRRGARTIRIIHGKGLHSEGGIGVLRDRVVSILTQGGAAPFVMAFVTASAERGGLGALVVRLRDR